MAEPNVHIRYIGKWASKTDNILPHSGRVWSAPGSTLRIPESQAAYYLKHPDEFELATPEFVASELAEGVANPRQVELLIDVIPFLDREALEKLDAAVKAQLSALKVTPVVPRTIEPASAQDGEWQAARRRQIAHALEQMDQRTEGDFTAGGKPRVARVQELTNLVPEVTAKEIESAQALAALV